MLPPDSPLEQLLAGPTMPGRLAWIGLRPAREMPMVTANSAVMISGRGIKGDHYDTRQNGARQVTLIAFEDIAAIASFLGKEVLRRTYCVGTSSLRGSISVALKSRRFRIGPTLLEWSGECAPCSRMETDLGPGGFNAVRGHGGITARVIEGGEVQLGDAVERVG